jgi:hypothetical protein
VRKARNPPSANFTKPLSSVSRSRDLRGTSTRSATDSKPSCARSGCVAGNSPW